MRKMKNRVLTKSFLLFGAAAALLLASTVGSTRAALTYQSENYEMRIEVPSIGVSLIENGSVVSRRDYVENDWKEESSELLADIPGTQGNKEDKAGEAEEEKGEKLVLGKSYPEKLWVHNSGTIDSYVRAIVYKNWTKGDGETANTKLSPDLIELKLTEKTLSENGWIVDKDASTPERTVLYYSHVLPSDKPTSAFSDILRINPSIGDKVTETQTGNTITTEFAYNGYQFNIKVEVDAVQTHNAVEAIRSAWGVDVTVGANGDLTLQRGGTGAVVQ